MGVAAAIDITPEQQKTIQALLRRYLPGTAAWAYGSRVKWTSRPQSDLDLVVFATRRQRHQVGDLREAFEESSLPFRVDLFVWDDVPASFRTRIEAEHVPLARPARPSCPDGWVQGRLGDVMVLKRGYDLPERDRCHGPVPVVSSSGITDHHSESRAPGPGVVTGRYGTLGQVFFVPNDFWPLNTALYVQDFKGNDPRFISYFLRTLDFSRFSDKAAVPGLNRNHLHEETVRIPGAVAEQRAIAHVLGTLDDKIELNRRMNATLEAIAQALFRSWFVDFDPVRAKMEGRDTGLPKEIADLFPSRFVESEMGRIPEGWRVGHLGDAFEITMGQSPPGHTYNDTGDGLPFFQGRSDFGFRYPTNRKFCTAPNRMAQPWDTIVSVRAPVGDINMAWERCCIGRGVAVLRPRSGAVSYGYCTAQALQPNMREYEHTGTVFGAINREQLARLPLQQPSANVVRAFEHFVHPLDQTIRLHTAQSDTLTAVRDALLPRLVSGEIRVRDAEELAGAIV